MTLSSGEVVAILREAAAFLTSLAAVIAAISARRTAQEAKKAAATAHEKATEAVREQINFGLRRVARETVQEMNRSQDFIEVRRDSRPARVPSADVAEERKTP
jgi:hypothetical protein